MTNENKCEIKKLKIHEKQKYLVREIVFFFYFKFSLK